MSKQPQKKRKHIARVKRELKQIKNQTVDKLGTLLTTAFGIVAALAWNSAIQEWFKNNEYLHSGGPWAYAIFVTIIAVIVAIWVSRITAKFNVEEEKK